MNINNAMDQVDEIHKHLSRSEVFRGYRAMTAVTIAIVAILTALYQTYIKKPENNIDFIFQWIIIAAAMALLTAGSIAVEYIIKGSNFEKKQTIRVFSQFAPSLIIGFGITMLFIHYRIKALEVLPAIWAILFSMGIFAMRPFLPRFIGYVGLFYLLSGCMLIRMVPMHTSLTPMAMGFTFGVGHLFAALILYLGKERV